MRAPALFIALVLLAGCEKPSPPSPPAMKLDCVPKWASATDSFAVCADGDPDGLCERLTFSVPVDQLKVEGVSYTCKVPVDVDLILTCVINRETSEFSANVEGGEELVVMGDGKCTASAIAYTF